ncbi:MAG: nuclear transport factor 2 family protein [Trebonia sp.]
MNEIERLAAIEEIKQVKARYFRGVDTGDGNLVRSILAEDCVLDYRGGCTDPATGKDYVPATNAVLRGREAWPAGTQVNTGMVSVHHGYNCEIEITSDTTATAIWSMTDRLHFPPGGQFSVMTGYGHYHETYEKAGGAWKLKTTRLTRIRVEAA